MKIATIAMAALAAGALVTASPAQADITAPPVPARVNPLQPPSGDALADVQELQRQTSELHANWDNLTPEQRNQQLAQLQRQTTIVQNEVDSMPPEQRPEVQARLSLVALELADILRREWPFP